MLKSAIADNFKFWLTQQQPHNLSRLLGTDVSGIIKVTENFEPAVGVDMMQALLEIPLLGNPCADLSLSYDSKSFRTNYFTSEIGNKILPLFRYFSMLLPDNNLMFIEMDTSKHNEIPAIFLDCIDHKGLIFERLWQKGAEPVQWNRAWELTKKLPPPWKLLYIGFLPNRQEIPLKLIFAKLNGEGDYLPNTQEDIEKLLNHLGHSPLPEDAQEKLNFLFNLHHNRITVSVDLLPNKQFGPILGMEVFLPENLDTPQDMLNTEQGKTLLNQLQKWQLADDRAQCLSPCCGIFFPPQKEHCLESQIQVFLNHIKLRWLDGQPLPIKAYLAINSYFR